MRLLLDFPLVATRDCQHCQKWLYDEDTGRVATRPVSHPDNPSITIDEPIPRYKGVLPPCKAPGRSCPKGSPDAAIELSQQNWKAYAHFQQCKTLGKFPEDSIVERNAAIIGGCLAAYEQAQRRLEIEYLRLCAIRPPSPS